MSSQKADFFIWDAHVCLPLSAQTDLSLLDVHHQFGVNYVSVNVGMDMNCPSQILQVIGSFRYDIQASDNKMLISCCDDLFRAKEQGKLGIAFDLEGGLMLNEDPRMIDVFYHLGVRQIHLAYNRNNGLAGGCHDVAMGLTPIGRRVVKRIHEVGMMMDCSHTGEKSSLEICDIFCGPVVFSHAGVRRLCDHGRCLSDAQIKACAQTNGVIGICGLNRFLGVKGQVSAQDIFHHIDYIVQYVGIDHVGLGSDYMHEVSGLTDFPDGVDSQYWWPHEWGYGPQAPLLEMFPPEKWGELIHLMERGGYGPSDMIKVMGGNFIRVAQNTWQPKYKEGKA